MVMCITGPGRSLPVAEAGDESEVSTNAEPIEVIQGLEVSHESSSGTASETELHEDKKVIQDVVVEPSLSCTDSSPPQITSSSNSSSQNSEQNVYPTGSKSTLNGTQAVPGDTKRSRRGRPSNPEQAIPLSTLIRRLTDPKTGQFPNGVTPKGLFNYVQTMPEPERPTRSRNHLQVLLFRDVGAGDVARVKLGYYAAPEFAAAISLNYPTKKVSTTATVTTEKLNGQIKSPNNQRKKATAPPRPARMIKPTVPFGAENRQQRSPLRLHLVSVDPYRQDTTNNGNVRTSPRQSCRRKLSAESGGTDNSNSAPGLGTKMEMKEGGEENGQVPILIPEAPKAKRKRVTKRNEEIGPGKKNKSSICDYCLNQKRKNDYGRWENLLICSECNAKAHPTCMGYVPEQATKCFRAPTWQCIDCKICCLCNTIDSTKDVIFCDCCEKCYHFKCHDPPLVRRPEGGWKCKSCDNSASISPLIASLREEALAIIRTSQCLSSVPTSGSQEEGSSGPPLSSCGSQSSILNSSSSPSNAVIENGCGGEKTSPGGQQKSSADCFIQYNKSISIMLPQYESRDKLCAVLLRQPTSIVEKLQATAQNHLESCQMTDHLTVSNWGVYEKAVINAQNWSVADVSKFISDLGFPRLANVFLEQEIDGSSLLLLRRSDILQLLGLKLGPALKLYHRILKLQNLVSLRLKEQEKLNDSPPPPLIFDDACEVVDIPIPIDFHPNPQLPEANKKDDVINPLPEAMEEDDDFIEMPKLELNSDSTT